MTNVDGSAITLIWLTLNGLGQFRWLVAK